MLNIKDKKHKMVEKTMGILISFSLLDLIKKNIHWLMLSAPKLPSTKVEAKDEEVEEEEVEGLLI